MLLGRILHAYPTCQSRALKGIEILSVTSYDAALDGLLLQGSPSFRPPVRTIPVEFLLSTMVVLWEKSTQSLRFKLNSVRQDRYYEVEALWKAISSHLDLKGQTSATEKLLCELLPLMAFWDPATMTRHLDPTLRFLTRNKPSSSESLLQHEDPRAYVIRSLMNSCSCSPHCRNGKNCTRSSDSSLTYVIPDYSIPVGSDRRCQQVSEPHILLSNEDRSRSD